ncbi:MAG TPA: primosomal protein N' [Methylomirabilota bacterium]|nr:primosomal protein N' [Methylomirabilota bacterium]
MIVADVSFDAPLPHPFSYRVPDDWRLTPGQRVIAPLGRANRTGVIVALREHEASTDLKSLLGVVDRARVLDGDGLALARWIAEQSLSSLGSTLAALLPPAASAVSAVPAAAERERGPASVPKPELLVGTGRETRLLERLGGGPALVIVPDVEAAARWSQRLARHGIVARLDSGVADEERAAAWAALRAGTTGLAVGTRSALLAPLPARARLALVDEHEAAHKPPGPPRLHSRDVVLERAAREARPVLLTSGTPSVEMWWRADSGRAALDAAAPAAWPSTQVADTRGILRREPLTPALARAVRETLAAGRRVLLVVSRLTSALACDECGEVLRCSECGVALAYARAARSLACRVCGRVSALPDTCPACRGRRLSPFGWGAERVEHAVRRRFPEARVARYDPDATRGARRDAQRRAAAEAEVVVGTRGALRLFGPGALGLAGFVAPDQFLRLPDFRAGERLFSLIWAAAERVARGGALVIQSQTPEHYVVDAALRQDLGAFYRQELKFRGELGYPPFRRLAVLTITAKTPADRVRLAQDVCTALATDRALTVYPPAPDRRDRVRRIVVKGREDLPAHLAAVLTDFAPPRSKSRGIMEVEVDPVEWQF